MKKIKTFVNENYESILLVCIIIFVGISSFFLGRLSIVSGSLKHDVLVTNVNNQDAIDLFNHLKETSVSSGEKVYVASRNGTKYYLSWCSGANKIKETNKIFFSSAEEAEKAGYGRASGCDE